MPIVSMRVIMVGVTWVCRAVNMSYYCNFCPFRCTKWKENVKHVFQCHSSSPNFRYVCGLSGCVQSFKTYSAYSSHLLRKHENRDFTQLQSAVVTDPVSGPESQKQDLENDVQLSGIEDHDGLYTPTVTSTPAQRSSALLLLTLKERYRLTQAGVNFSVDQVKQVVENVLDEVKSSVQERVGDDHYVDDCFDVDPFH